MEGQDETIDRKRKKIRVFAKILQNRINLMNEFACGFALFVESLFGTVCRVNLFALLVRNLLRNFFVAMFSCLIWS